MARSDFFSMGIKLPPASKQKLDMLRTLLQITMSPPQLVTWDMTIIAALDMIPIASLLTDALQQHTTQFPQENVNELEPPIRDERSRRPRLDPRATQRKPTGSGD